MLNKETLMIFDVQHQSNLCMFNFNPNGRITETRNDIYIYIT